LEIFDAFVVDRCHVVLEVLGAELETRCPLVENGRQVLVHHVQSVVGILRPVLLEADCLEALGKLETFRKLCI
jgi:branched-subunit amino acid permease